MEWQNSQELSSAVQIADFTYFCYVKTKQRCENRAKYENKMFELAIKDKDKSANYFEFSRI